jgi:hypothetical protein
LPSRAKLDSWAKRGADLAIELIAAKVALGERVAIGVFIEISMTIRWGLKDEKASL